MLPASLCLADDDRTTPSLDRARPNHTAPARSQTENLIATTFVYSSESVKH